MFKPSMDVNEVLTLLEEDDKDDNASVRSYSSECLDMLEKDGSPEESPVASPVAKVKILLLVTVQHLLAIF